ncbi:class II histone deacetylase [Corynebacterium halotolerans]|uniref:class II histone deacetylase n=1 Tax=Corynebacterium halotolerans TaxID=225326 RepID=UPI003CF5D86E
MVRRLVGYVWDTLYGWVPAGDDEIAPVMPGSRAHFLGHQAAHAELKRQLHEAIQLSAIASHLHPLVAEPAQRPEILRVHSEEHVEWVRTRSTSNSQRSREEGYTSHYQGNYDIALRAAGGAISATRAVLDDEVDTAYALINPPGHHASRDNSEAYCLFNNVSVAAAFARESRGISRVAIVDLDVHHGNGTQSIWWDNPEVLTISIHQERCFPADSGFREERGSGEGFGANLNIPLPAGSGNAAYENTIAEVVLPALEAFDPELILVACGFDAAILDPYGRMMVTKQGFRTMTRQLLEAADRYCDGNIVFIQEGGHSVNYMPACGLGVLEEMTGVEAGVDDTFLESLENQVVNEIYDHQREAIGAAAELIRDVPAPATVPVSPGRSG